MTVARASVEEGARLAVKARTHSGQLEKLRAEQDFHAHVNPEHYAELARDWLRLRRVEEAVRHVVNDSPGTPGSVKQYLRAAIANPAAEECSACGHEIHTSGQCVTQNCFCPANPAADG